MKLETVQQIIAMFSTSTARLQQIAIAVEDEITNALAGRASSLPMLPAYVPMPTGKERGTYVALDFGGTNMRVAKIRLNGNGQFTVLKKVSQPLQHAGLYNFTGKKTTATMLFDFIAELIGQVVLATDEDILLGHTFSFATDQTSLQDACLRRWTKEFSVTHMVGQPVNELLRVALQRKGLSNVYPVALINDTTGTLLAGLYKHANVRIGAIYATGFNACYVEMQDQGNPMIFNMECGFFDKLDRNIYDCQLDQLSENPGGQRLEKMVSGRYLGTLLALCAEDVEGGGHESCTGAELSLLLRGGVMATAMLSKKWHRRFTPVEMAQWCALATAIVIRSARLSAGIYSGILGHLRPSVTEVITNIAIDGAVYDNMPLVAVTVQQTLAELLGSAAANVEIFTEKDGSGLGAALAAASVDQQRV